MSQMTRRDLLVLGTLVAAFPRNRTIVAEEMPEDVQETLSSLDLSAQKGRAFLVVLFDAELDFLPEYPGALSYWLYNDNFLAAKLLAESHPLVARRIQAAIEREKIQHSGKMEVLFEKSEVPFTFRKTEPRDIRGIRNKTIRTESVLDEPFQTWEDYADLLLISCIAEQKPAAARRRWHEVNKNMWDGKGFADVITQKNQRYSTYKVALALIAARKLRVDPPPGAFEILHSMQDVSGGWITDYDAHRRRIGFANVVTTCLSILGIEAYRAFIAEKREK